MIIGKGNIAGYRVFVHGGAMADEPFTTLYNPQGEFVNYRDWTDTEKRIAAQAIQTTLELWDTNPPPELGYQSVVF
jgi:hypothetical protein